MLKDIIKQLEDRADIVNRRMEAINKELLMYTAEITHLRELIKEYESRDYDPIDDERAVIQNLSRPRKHSAETSKRKGKVPVIQTAIWNALKENGGKGYIPQIEIQLANNGLALTKKQIYNNLAILKNKGVVTQNDHSVYQLIEAC